VCTEKESVCMRVRVCVKECVRVCVSARAHVCVCMFVYVSMFVHTYLCTNLCVYIIYRYTYTSVRGCKSVRVYIYTYRYTLRFERNRVRLEQVLLVHDRKQGIQTDP